MLKLFTFANWWKIYICKIYNIQTFEYVSPFATSQKVLIHKDICLNTRKDTQGKERDKWTCIHTEWDLEDSHLTNGESKMMSGNPLK